MMMTTMMPPVVEAALARWERRLGGARRRRRARGTWAEGVPVGSLPGTVQRVTALARARAQAQLPP